MGKDARCTRSDRQETAVTPYSRSALACHALATLILIAFGLVYLGRSEFMPYHAAAMGLDWASVAPGTRQVLLALMHALGGACLSVAILVGVLLWGPFRRGAAWATWTVPLAGFVLCATSLYAQIGVALRTPASPPMLPVIAAGVLLALGLWRSRRWRQRDVTSSTRSDSR